MIGRPMREEVRPPHWAMHWSMGASGPSSCKVRIPTGSSPSCSAPNPFPASTAASARACVQRIGSGLAADWQRVEVCTRRCNSGKRDQPRTRHTQTGMGKSRIQREGKAKQRTPKAAWHGFSHSYPHTYRPACRPHAACSCCSRPVRFLFRVELRVATIPLSPAGETSPALQARLPTGRCSMRGHRYVADVHLGGSRWI